MRLSTLPSGETAPIHRLNRYAEPLERQVDILRKRLINPKKNVPAAKVDISLRLFVLGRFTLENYKALLNDKGQQALALTNELYFSKNKILFPDLWNAAFALPSIHFPRLDLFSNPFSEQDLSDPNFQAFKIKFNQSELYRIIQIATGCEKHCLMCGASASSGGKIRFMPFPMVLLLAKQLVEISEKPLFINLYDGTDPFSYKDEFFDADLADLIIALKRIGVRADEGVTHGFSASNRYATEAAEKCRNERFNFDLSIHLFHKSIFPSPSSAPNEKALDYFAARYAHSIETLRPKKIRLLADDSSLAINPCFSSTFLEKYFHDRVLPKLSPQLKRSITQTAEDVLVPQKLTFEGDVVGSPYFEQSRSSFFRTASIKHGKEYLKIEPDGQIELLSQPNGVTATTFIASKTVGETYQQANSTLFINFLRKLHFFLKSGHRDKLSIWTSYYPNFDLAALEQSLPEIDGVLVAISASQREKVFNMLKDLPIVDSDLFYQYTVADLAPHFVFRYSQTGINEERAFLMSFQEGREALEQIGDNNFYSAILQSFDQKPPALIRQMPIAFRKNFNPEPPKIRTRTILPFRAKTGL